MHPASTRTFVGERHALITPDTHVTSVLPGVTGAVAHIHISPALGADFTQISLIFEADGQVVWEPEDIETFVFVLDGECLIRIDERIESLERGGYAFAPAGRHLEIFRPNAGTRLVVFQKIFEEDAEDEPAEVFGSVGEIHGVPFLGDPDTVLKALLPDDPSYDLAVNVFMFKPGARSPFVETQEMEQGILILEGEGIYRLEDRWHPVSAGDVVWIAPYCPQWFVAIGKAPATCLCYKNVNRHPLA